MVETPLRFSQTNHFQGVVFLNFTKVIRESECIMKSINEFRNRNEVKMEIRHIKNIVNDNIG